jgi:hypothetical protein
LETISQYASDILDRLKLPVLLEMDFRFLECEFEYICASAQVFGVDVFGMEVISIFGVQRHPLEFRKDVHPFLSIFVV